MDSVEIERARIVAIIKEKHAKKECEQKERLTEKLKPKKNCKNLYLKLSNIKIIGT